MRKQSLRQIANHYFIENNCGSSRDKQYRRFVIQKMIGDLFLLGETPPNWHSLTAAHLQKLIEYWLKKRIKPSTLMNYMTIIRNFLSYIGHHLANIDNNNLGLPSKKIINKPTKISADLWQTINDPIARVLFGLQIHFGLTLSEAMRLLPGVHIQDQELLLTREMTFNSQDRKIPFRSDIQSTVINQFNALTQGNQSLIVSHGYRAVCFSWQRTVKALRLPSKKSYRYLYAQQLHAQLSSQLQHYRLSLLIMDEMGLKSRTSLWSYLHEQ